MKITAEQYAAALYNALQETNPAHQDAVLENFVKLLSENGHLEMFGRIEEEFVKFEQKKSGQVPIQATFAEEHSDKFLLDALNNVLGKDVVLKKKIDKDLIGGVVIETEDERIDASVRKHLSNLKKSLIN